MQLQAQVYVINSGTVTWTTIASVPSTAITSGISITNGATLNIQGISLSFGSSASIQVNNGTLNLSNAANVTVANGQKIEATNSNVNIVGSTLNFSSTSALVGKFIANNSQVTYTSSVGNFGAASVLECSNGTKLKITQGSTLKKHLSQQEFWGGIVATNVIGTQYSTKPTTTKNDQIAWSGVLNSNVTLVTVDGVSNIRDAKVGIESSNGAIVRTRDANFLNCEKGIYIRNYRAASPDEKLNASYIMKTNFEWTWSPVPSYLTFGSLKHVHLSNVGTINIGGCTFKNNISVVSGRRCFLENGIGIHAQTSDFTLAHDGDQFCDDEIGCPDNCYNSGTSSDNYFQKLGVGIQFDGNENLSNVAGIRFAKFDDNYYSIKAQNSSNFAVGYCEMSINNTIFNGFFQNPQFCSGGIPGGIVVQVQFTDISGLRYYKNETSSSRLAMWHMLIEQIISDPIGIIQ
jgi:hypothetical protein